MVAVLQKILNFLDNPEFLQAMEAQSDTPAQVGTPEVTNGNGATNGKVCTDHLYLAPFIDLLTWLEDELCNYLIMIS